MNATLRIMLATVAVGLAAVSARGQESPLKGPEVKDRAVPGAAPAFTEGEQGKFRQRELPVKAFQEALMKAIGPAAPESVRASEPVREEIRKLLAEHRQQVEAYMKEHRGEIESLRKRGKQGQADGAAMDERAKKDNEAMAQEGRGLREGAPKPTDAYTKVWTLLNPAQKEAAEAKIEEFRHAQGVREGKEYVKRRLEKAGGEKGKEVQERRKKAGEAGEKVSGGANSEEGKKIGKSEILIPDFRDRLLRLFERMTPEERELVLRRIEARQAERDGGEVPKK